MKTSFNIEFDTTELIAIEGYQEKIEDAVDSIFDMLGMKPKGKRLSESLSPIEKIKILLGGKETRSREAFLANGIVVRWEATMSKQKMSFHIEMEAHPNIAVELFAAYGEIFVMVAPFVVSTINNARALSEAAENRLRKAMERLEDL